MKKTKIGLLVLGVIAVVGLMRSPVLADSPLTGGPDTKAERVKAAFQGKVEAVDASAKTLTVDGKLIYTSDSTKITKASALIKLDHVMAGDEVRGTLQQTGDGKTEALTVNVGKGKDEKEKAAPKY